MMAERNTQKYGPTTLNVLLKRSQQFSNYSPHSSPKEKYYVVIIRVHMWSITGQ